MAAATRAAAGRWCTRDQRRPRSEPARTEDETHSLRVGSAGVDPLSVLLLAAILIGWVGLFALWWFGFRGRG